MPTVQVQTAQNVAIAYRTAGVGSRIAAYSLDVVVVIAYFALIFLVAVALPLEAITIPPAVSITLLVLLLLPVFGYHFLCEVFLNGQSIGKRATKIKVVRLDGGTPTVGAYFLRWILRLVDIALFNGVIAVVLIIVTDNDQRLGDLAAGTTVIRIDEPVSLDDALPLAPGPDHVGRFPRVRALSDEDMRTIHAVLARLRNEGRTAQSRRLTERTKAAVEQKMGIEPVAMPAHHFLRRVARDYAALDDTF